MPLYEYECQQCGVVEAVRSLSDPPLAKCPQCGRKKIKKIMSTPQKGKVR